MAVARVRSKVRVRVRVRSSLARLDSCGSEMMPHHNEVTVNDPEHLHQGVWDSRPRDRVMGAGESEG